MLYIKCNFLILFYNFCNYNVQDDSIKSGMTKHAGNDKKACISARPVFKESILTTGPCLTVMSGNLHVYYFTTL